MQGSQYSQIRIEGAVAFVSLTQGREAVIDAADVPLVSGKKWQARRDGRSWYALRSETLDGKRKTILMHRLLLGAPNGVLCDHKDCDGLNNRRSNLRCATRLENARNSRSPSNNTSGRKGVTFSKAAGRWMAQIAVSGKTRYLGLFDDVEAAHAAYAEASQKYHGDYGRAA